MTPLFVGSSKGPLVGENNLDQQQGLARLSRIERAVLPTARGARLVGYQSGQATCTWTFSSASLFNVLAATRVRNQLTGRTIGSETCRTRLENGRALLEALVLMPQKKAQTG
jgi:hypothetical protein